MNVLDLFAASPTAAKLKHEHDRAHHAKRKAVVEKRERALRERLGITEAYRRKLDPLERRVAEVRAMLTEAIDNVRSAECEYRAARASTDREIQQCESTLRRMQPAQIAAARDGLQRRFDGARGGLAREASVVIAGDTYARRVVRIGNRRAIERLVHAIGIARDALDRLVFEATDDLDAAIAQILEPVEAAWADVERLDDPPAA